MVREGQVRHPDLAGRRRAARLGVLSSLVFLTLALVSTLSSSAASAATAATQAPYTDSAAVGSLGLCNQAGQQVTSGSITTKPLAWRIVSTQPATGVYAGATRTAIVLAYQPRLGLPPGEWSGEAITASSRYTNPSAPMAAATANDYSLGEFISDFPATWNGFVQLRMYLGAANSPQYTQQYPTLNLQIIGNTWHAVGGTSVNCNSGTSVSIESILLPTTTTPVTSTTLHASNTTTTKPASSTHPKSSAASSGSSGGSGDGILIGVILAVVVLAVLGGLLLRQRLKARSKPQP